MKTKLFLSVSLLLVHQIVSAQKFDWNPSEKIEDNFNIHFAGANDKNAFFLLSKFSIKHDYRVSGYHNPITWTRENVVTLVKYNAKTYVSISKTPFTFNKEPLVFYDAFICDNNVNFFYTADEGGRSVFYVDKYDSEGQFKEAVVLYDPGKSTSGKQFYFITSENKNFICLYQNNGSLMLFDKTLKKLWTNKFESEYLTDLVVLDDGTVLALGGSDNKQDLLRYDLSGKSTLKNISYSESVVCGFNIKADEKNKLIYVVTSYGVAEKGFKLTFGPSRRSSSDFLAKGVLVNAFDLGTLAEKKSLKIAYSDELLLVLSGKKKLEKVKGLDKIGFTDLFFTGDGGVLVLLQKQYTERNDLMDSNGRLLRTDYTDNYENIIMLRSDKNGNAVQKQFERTTAGKTHYGYLLSMVAFYANDQLNILYNYGVSSYELRMHTFNANLEEVSKKAEQTYKSHKIYLSLINYQKIGDNKYFIWGREAKYVGSAVLSF